jgi:hypothetical protein
MMPPPDDGTPFRDDPWNLPPWTYPVHWVLVILFKRIVTQCPHCFSKL